MDETHSGMDHFQTEDFRRTDQAVVQGAVAAIYRSRCCGKWGIPPDDQMAMAFHRTLIRLMENDDKRVDLGTCNRKDKPVFLGC